MLVVITGSFTKREEIWKINKFEGNRNSFWTDGIWAIFQPSHEWKYLTSTNKVVGLEKAQTHHPGRKTTSSLCLKMEGPLYFLWVMRTEFWISTRMFPVSSCWIPKSVTSRRSDWEGNGLSHALVLSSVAKHFQLCEGWMSKKFWSFIKTSTK